MRDRMRKQSIDHKKRLNDRMERYKQLPPLPENYFGSQIDEVSSTRDSIIENESKINKYKISAKE